MAVWQEVKTQWRAGPAGIIGLDYHEVRQAVKELGLDWTRRLKRKVQTIERVIINHANSTDK